MPAENLIAISRLQRLMDMTDLMVGDDAIPKLLEEIARVLEETSGFAGVVINAYRPQWDDFQVTSVAGYLDGGPDPDAWRPGDELFVPCRDSAGHILAVVSLGEPVSGRRPSDADLDYLVAIGASAACALDHGQRAQEAARHRAALEELLAVSSRLACQDSIELVLEAVCAGVARALASARS